MGLFARRQTVERRAASFQSVWGTGGEWSPSDRGYNTTDALGLWPVVACVRYRANLIGQLPLVAYVKDRDGFSVRAPMQPDLLVAPSGQVTKSSWLFQMSLSRDVWGNAFGAVVARDGVGNPKQIEWLCPANVRTVQSVTSGTVEFYVHGQLFPAHDLVVVPSTFILPGSPLGVAPLHYSGLVDLGKRAQEFGSDWFRNGAVPSSVIYSDAELTNEQANNIRDRVTSAWQKRRPGVLGAGLKWEQTKITANESQFTETIAATASAVAAVFGVPAAEVGIPISGTSLTYANRTDAKEAAIDRMNGDLVSVEQVLDRLVADPLFVKFTTGAYAKSSTKPRYEEHAIGLASGFLTVDEVRRMEDRPPLGESQMSARTIAEAIQKLYLGVGVVISDDEAREILNREGAGLVGSLSKNEGE